MLYATNVTCSSVHRHSPTTQLRVVSVSVLAPNVLTIRIECSHRFASRNMPMTTAPNGPPLWLLRGPQQFADHGMLRQLAGIEAHQIALELLKVSRQ